MLRIVNVQYGSGDPCHLAQRGYDPRERAW